MYATQKIVYTQIGEQHCKEEYNAEVVKNNGSCQLRYGFGVEWQ